MARRRQTEAAVETMRVTVGIHRLEPPQTATSESVAAGFVPGHAHFLLNAPPNGSVVRAVVRGVAAHMKLLPDAEFDGVFI